jgi:CpeT protein
MMNAKTKTLLTLILPLLLLSATAQAGDLQDLVTMMTGSFSSQAQAQADSANFYDIRLEMKPIWTDNPDGHWFYVEQAVASHKEKPYRQRVYHVTQVEENLFSSMVFTVPDPEAAIGAWRDEEPLSQWGPEDLEERQGCAVYLERRPDGSFAGSTRARECTSSLRGATYATSEITITADRVVSWDRGFDAEDNHVWGAEKGGYVFMKVGNYDQGPGVPENPRME